MTSFLVATPLFDLGGNGFRDLRVFIGVQKFLAQEADVVIDLNDTALRGEIFDHLVGHIPARVADGAARGMRGNQRSLAHLQRVVKRFVADVRNVHHHAEPVHLANHVFPEIRQAVVHRRVGR